MKKECWRTLQGKFPLKKGDFQPSRETKSKKNILFIFYFLLLSYRSRLCTWVRFFIHHPRSIYLIGEILFSSFNKPFILMERFGTSISQTHIFLAQLLFYIFFFFFQNLFEQAISHPSTELFSFNCLVNSKIG